MAAIDGLDSATAQKIMVARETQHFRLLADVRTLVGPELAIDERNHAVASAYFEVQGRLRLGNTVVQERSVVRKQGIEVTTLRRERGAFGDGNTSMAIPGRL